MDEVIEEEMSQDLEKGFLALGIVSLVSYLQFNGKNVLYGDNFTFLVVIAVKYTRDPATFYAAKLQKSLQDGDTDTAGRVIFTSSTVNITNYFISFTEFSCVNFTEQLQPSHRLTFRSRMQTTRYRACLRISRV